MSYEINVFCSISKLPSFETWQRELKEKKSNVQFTENFNLEDQEGFVSCHSQNIETGFEYFCEPITKEIKEDLEAQIPESWNILISFIARGYDEMAASVAAASILAGLTNGGLSEEGEMPLIRFTDDFTWARDRLSEISIEKQKSEDHKEEVERIQSSGNPTGLFTEVLQELNKTKIEKLAVMMGRLFIMKDDIRLFSNSWNIDTSDKSFCISRYKRIRDKQMAILRKSSDIDDVDLSELEAKLHEAAQKDEKDLSNAVNIIEMLVNPFVDAVKWHQKKEMLELVISSEDQSFTFHCFTGEMSSLSLNKGRTNLEFRAGEVHL